MLAAISRPYHALLPVYQSQKTIRPIARTAVGLTFTVGDKPIFVHHLGREFTGGCEGPPAASCVLTTAAWR